MNTQLLIVILLASAPALIWSIIIFRGRKTSRWPLFLAFFLGTLTVLPLMGLNYLWLFYPQLDIYKAIETNISEVHLAALASLVVVGILEELTKSGVVRIVDKTKIGIHTINDALKYSILAGLGFAFTENIFYFYYIWQSSGFFGLLFPLIFRSMFTVSAHMVFSGIFGYYYGLAKFSSPILEQQLWLGEKSKSVLWMSKILGVDEANAFRQMTLLKGLLISMSIHAAFNFLLEFEYLIPTILIVIIGFGYLLYLMAHKAGAIVFSGPTRAAKIQKKDEDVVIELMAMWTKEGRYQDVIDICQRLLMRDPDNKVVQLFQARAMDEQKLSSLETSFSSLFKSDDKKADDKSLRNLVRQKILMEMLKEKSQPMPAQFVPKPTLAVPTPEAMQKPVTTAPVQVMPQDVSLKPEQNGQSSQPSSPAEAPHVPSIPKPDISQQ